MERRKNSLALIKNELHKHQGEEILIWEKPFRGKAKVHRGKVNNVFPRHFNIETEEGVVTFNYPQIITQDVMIEIQ